MAAKLQPERSVTMCEYADHKWSMDIEEGRVILRCKDPHTEEEQEAMALAHDGKIPACAMLDYIDDLDIFLYDVPVSLNYYWVPGGYENPQDGECVLDLTILPQEEHA